MPTLLVRYGEIGLKSESVRRRFEQQLVKDIRTRHSLAGTQCVITQMRGRLFVDSDDWRRSCEILSKTFGVVSFSPSTPVPSDLESLRRSTVEFAEPLLFKGASFAIRSRRSGNHPYTSQSLAGELGEAVRKAYADLGVTVDLDEPDVEISVEVRERTAYLFSSVLAGPGGMPLGTQGRVLCDVPSEHGVASAWLMMKRGCSVLLMCEDPGLVEPLASWYPNLKSIERQVNLFSAAADNQCMGVALPMRLEDMRSTPPPKGDLPVFYPLVGMDREEIMGLLARIRS